MSEYILGIDVGGTKIALGILLGESLVARREFPFDPSADADTIFEKLTDTIALTLGDASLRAADISAVGLGVPGTIRPDRRSLQFAANAPLLNGFPLCDKLSALFPGVPVVMENDANAAALAEHILGAGKGLGDMLYCTISTGVGGGLILNDTLFRGPNMAAGEIGHMVVYPGGAPCGCGGHGHAEAYAGGANYPRAIRARIEAGEPTVMAELAEQSGRLDGRVLAAALAEGDAMAQDILAQIASAVALLFYNTYKLLGLQTFVLGGGLTNLGDTLFDAIRAALTGLYTPMDAGVTLTLLPARFSSAEIGVYGAALSALY